MNPIAIDESGSMTDEQIAAVHRYLVRRSQAHRIKARRRRLGQNGFATGTMAVPRAKKRGRNRR